MSSNESSCESTRVDVCSSSVHLRPQHFHMRPHPWRLRCWRPYHVRFANRDLQGKACWKNSSRSSLQRIFCFRVVLCVDNPAVVLWERSTVDTYDGACVVQVREFRVLCECLYSPTLIDHLPHVHKKQLRSLRTSPMWAFLDTCASLYGFEWFAGQVYKQRS